MMSITVQKDIGPVFWKHLWTKFRWTDTILVKIVYRRAPLSDIVINVLMRSLNVMFSVEPHVRFFEIREYGYSYSHYSFNTNLFEGCQSRSTPLQRSTLRSPLDLAGALAFEHLYSLSNSLYLKPVVSDIS